VSPNQPQREPDDREVTLGDYGQVIWRGRWIILTTVVIAALVGLALTFVRTTTYSASAQLFLGQATTISGTPVSTPPTNPVTAPAVLEGDAIVDAVSRATGVSPSGIRNRISFDIPRAPGSAGNLPTLVKITYRDDRRARAVEVTTTYAKAILAAAARTFNTRGDVYERQIAGEKVRIADLKGQIADLQRRSAAGEPGADVALVAASQLLSTSEQSLDTFELGLATAEQIEQPQLVSLPERAASSSSGPRRARTVLISAALGLIIGLIISFLWRGPRRAGDTPA
jgi:cell division protein FtsL